jgi:hypothetical protein
VTGDDAADHLAKGLPLTAFVPSQLATQALLDGLVSNVRRYVVLTDVQADAVALWIMHTHAIEAADVTPYLAILSAEKRSGKTLLLHVLRRLVARPLPTANISDSALFRSIADGRPTLLLDEVDAIFGARARDREDLRGILNAGYFRGEVVIRMGGPTMTDVVGFPVFCAKAFAGIGRLPDTITDRSIVLTVRRKAPDEVVERFRRREVDAEFERFSEPLQAWGAANLEALTGAQPELPGELDDRAADGWEPLLAIADLAGGPWPGRARRAALELLAGASREDESPGIRLLADLRSVFAERAADKLSSSDLVQALVALEESPWGDLRGRPLDARGLAQRLRPFEIRPKTIRLDEHKTLKGYEAEQFECTWRRYLPSAAPLHRVPDVTPSQPASLRERSPSSTVSVDPLVTDASEGTNRHGHRDVTLVTGTPHANGSSHASREAQTRADANSPVLLTPGVPGFEGLTRRRFLETSHRG